MHYQITHRTTYAYTSEVTVSQHIARLTPRPLPHQQLLTHELTIDPAPAERRPHTDYFGNPATYFTLATPHRTLTVTARSTLDLAHRTWPDPAATPNWETARPADAAAQLPLETHEFAYPSALIPALPALADYARPSFAPGRPLLEAALDLTHRIHTDFTFDPAATTVSTPLERVLTQRRGVCQDFAHLQIGCLRALGLAARYISGYLETLPPPGREKLTGADASHAWLQLYVPGHGWIDIDPTNDLLPDTRHILLAWGRDYDDISPLRGVISGGDHHTLAVSVDVTPA